MNKPIIILGAGGHAQVLIETLLRMGLKIQGLCDLSDKTSGKKILDIPILGSESILDSIKPASVNLVNGVGSTNSQEIRKKVFLKFKDKGFIFKTIIDPISFVSPSVKILEGSQILANVSIQTLVKVGMNTIINTGSILDHNCQIGNHCHIATGSSLSGDIIVGDETHIGTGSSIIHGIQIGKKTIIGAGSVVVKNIAANKVAFGNPAKVKK